MYNVRNDKIEEALRLLAEKISKDIPTGWGFTLLLFDFNMADGSLFYISTAEREDMTKAMKEFIKRNEM